jgi:hypothetical protein
MLRYFETNWLSEEGLRTRSYHVNFSEVKSRLTAEEQKKRAERLSFVRIFNQKETDVFFEICAQLQKVSPHFYFNKNRKFHTTLLGFPVIEQAYYGTIKEKINEFCERTQEKKMTVKFDLLRLGTKYEHNNLKPVPNQSNGTVIAIGSSRSNKTFTTFGNNLCSYLLKDKVLRKVLGKKFRRRFPSVWCTMGHYTTDFKVTIEIETLFSKFQNLDDHFFEIPCYHLELGTSHYKDLRDWKRITKFSLARR